MAYAIERDEPISAALPRIVVERIDEARRHLLDRKAKPLKRIHDARKRFKEARAAVRLIRDPLGDRFAVENAWFRDAGRKLATLRDQDAVVEALERVTAACEDRAERRAVKSAARRLQQAPARDRESGPVMRDVAEQLPAAKSRVLSWPPLGDEFETIGSGLARTYADGQAGFRSALRAPSPETFHEWRKRVKDHWYHTQILRQIGEDLMTAYREQMETLSDLLGQRHDLDVVRQVVRDAPSRFGSDNDLRLLWNAIDRHSDHLTGSALKIGAVAYSEPTEVVAQRFEAWWRTWCEETAPAGHAVAAG